MIGSLASLVRPYEDPQKKLTQGLQGLGSSLEGWAQDVKNAKQKRLNDSLGVLLSQDKIDWNKVNDLLKDSGVAEAAIALKAASSAEKAKEKEIFLKLGMPVAQIINSAYNQNEDFPLGKIRDYVTSRGVGPGRALMLISLLQDSGVVPSAKETRSRNASWNKTYAGLAGRSGEIPVTKEAAQRLKKYGIKVNTYPGAFDTALTEYPSTPGPTIDAQKYRKNLLARQMPDETSYTIGHPVAAKTEKPIIKFGFDNIGGQLWKVERIIDPNTGNILSTKKVRLASTAEQNTFTGTTPENRNQQIKNLMGQVNYLVGMLSPKIAGLTITDLNDPNQVKSSMQLLNGILDDTKGKYTENEKYVATQALSTLHQVLRLMVGSSGGTVQPQQTNTVNFSLGQTPGAANTSQASQNQGQSVWYDYTPGKGLTLTPTGNRVWQGGR